MRPNTIATSRPILIQGRHVYRNIFANITHRCLVGIPPGSSMHIKLILANPDSSPMKAVAVFSIDEELVRRDFLVVHDAVFEPAKQSDFLAKYTWAILPNGDIVDVS